MQGKATGDKRYEYGAGEAEILLQIFDWYARGRSATCIAAELNRRAIPSVKDSDTGKRRQVQRPRSEWIQWEVETLRIVPQEKWDAVKHRSAYGRRRSATKSVSETKRGCGRAPRYAFSSLIK